MFLKALVLDTNDFRMTGKIRVRVASKFFGGMVWDLSKDSSFSEKGVSRGSGDDLGVVQHNDFDVYVFTPFGVGENNSLFYVPRVNSIGLVAPIGAIGSNDFVWMGGIFEQVLSDKKYEQAINIPSDKENDETMFGSINGRFTIDRDNAIILRTKSTKMPEDSSKIDDKKDWFDWKKRDTENLIVIDDFKMFQTHFIEYNGTSPTRAQTLFMGTETTIGEDRSVTIGETKIKLQQYNTEDNVKKERSLTISDEEIVLYNYAGTTKNVLSLSKTAVDIFTTIDGKEVEYRQSKNGITLTYGSTVISVANNSIGINADKAVYISAPEVRIGNTNQRIVTTTSVLDNFKIADGVILSTSKVGYA